MLFIIFEKWGLGGQQLGAAAGVCLGPDGLSILFSIQVLASISFSSVYLSVYLFWKDAQSNMYILHFCMVKV